MLRRSGRRCADGGDHIPPPGHGYDGSVASLRSFYTSRWGVGPNGAFPLARRPVSLTPSHGELSNNTSNMDANPYWDPTLGPHTGTPHWDPTLGPTLGPHTGTPHWDPTLGPHTGTPHWDPHWDPTLGPHTGTHTLGPHSGTPLW
ncbi:hypothetical protein NHX12_020442, partial [Muraenolepis orangiensis]